MSRQPKVLNPDETYTFSQYFELPFDIEDILADLDCKVGRASLVLPRYPETLDRLCELHEQIQDGIRYVSMTSDKPAGSFSSLPSFGRCADRRNNECGWSIQSWSIVG